MRIGSTICERKEASYHPRKGEYILLIKGGNFVSIRFSSSPQSWARKLITPTVHGNLLTGPTAEDITDKEAVNTTAEGLAQVMEKRG
ncbi:MAG: hypothetical protein ACLVLH_16295 [Eisenbergiella massiliensis]